MRSFSDLTERELLALAISNEEEDGRIYADFAEGLQENYPDTARVFLDMAEEENQHRRPGDPDMESHVRCPRQNVTDAPRLIARCCG